MNFKSACVVFYLKIIGFKKNVHDSSLSAFFRQITKSKAISTEFLRRVWASAQKRNVLILLRRKFLSWQWAYCSQLEMIFLGLALWKELQIVITSYLRETRKAGRGGILIGMWGCYHSRGISGICIIISSWPEPPTFCLLVYVAHLEGPKHKKGPGLGRNRPKGQEPM